MSIKKRISAFSYAFKGLNYFFKDGVHAKIMLVFAVVVVGMGLAFKIEYYEWITVFLCIGLVLSLEALNSAIEYLVDLVSPQYHILAKKCKDVAAAGVLIFSLFSAIIGLLIFTPKIINLINGI